MEVDQAKETPSGAMVWSLDHLPNEILLKIFRNFSFWELIFYTTISPRWNELCFYLLRDRVTFQLQREMLIPPQFWTPDRCYRDVSYVTDFLPDGSSFYLQPFAEHVQKLDLTFYRADDGSLLEFLRSFGKVVTLALIVDRLQPRKPRPRFLEACAGILPEVRHLTIRCCYLKLLGLLAEVAPRLVTLDVELVVRVLPQFFECQLGALESLTLRLNMSGVDGRTIEDTFPKAALVQFLSQMRHVRKFGIFVDFFYPVFDVASALPSVEELTVSGKFSVMPVNKIFNCVHQMPLLRSLSINVESFHCLELDEPVPQVAALKVTGSIRIHLPTLARTFPNLRVLSVKLQDISTDAELSFALSRWENTLEELSIEIPLECVQKTAAIFNILRKIRKITFDFKDYYMDDIAFLSSIVSMETLQELHIRRVGGEAWRETVPELCERLRCPPSCALFVDGYRVGLNG
ncbi:predicted protein [Culex quinquefasciatus]|uniref:Predicted protein n=1 Tax=Culex quinquefasciatus TaxID=7176 RepID=B0WF82_CULQU|nr:predicted protein [Culex quinquefasciatus]|eukprot:XP_001847366.1 predicted protein [Culex quinquefasciatus]